MRQYNWTEHSVHLAQVFEDCPGHFFRLGDDIGPQFMSTMYNLIWTYQKALPYSRKHGVPPSRPGCWVYPDMLEVGIGLNTTESRTHFVRTYLSSNCVFARVLLGNFRESFDGCVSLRRLTTGSVGCHVRTACDRLRPRKRNFVQRALPYHRQQACAER